VVSQTSELTRAIALFDKEKFTEAEPVFAKILDKKPTDFMVNYFYGACRTENNHFSNTDLECLITANEEVSPININYYFGVQYHARSNWERALKYYTRYKVAATEKDIAKRKVSKKIQQCYAKINPYEEFMIEQSTDTTITEVTVKIEEEKTEQADTIYLNCDSLKLAKDTTKITDNTTVAKKVIELKETKGEAILFAINNEITYTNIAQFKTVEGKHFFEKGKTKQRELKNNIQETNKLRRKYAVAKTRNEKNAIGQQILANENSVYGLKKEMLEFLKKAQTTENKYWQNTTTDEIAKFIDKQNKAEKQKTIDINKTATDTIDPTILLIKNKNNGAAVEPDNNDLVYKIQLGAYRKLPNYLKKLYGKLSLFRKIDTYTDENGVVVYTTGNLTNYEDAVKMKNQVKQEGVEDTKVVPYFKGKRITLEKAKELESVK
jgi:putative lipoic acid-binding regulatory protein